LLLAKKGMDEAVIRGNQLNGFHLKVFIGNG
jgi:hypothetical protein